jgi:hypothetical protein
MKVSRPAILAESTYSDRAVFPWSGGAYPLADLGGLALVFHEAWLLSGAPKRKNAPELG